jgi:hypothetical protein
MLRTFGLQNFTTMGIVKHNNKIHDTDHKFTFVEILEEQKCSTTTNSGKK